MGLYDTVLVPCPACGLNYEAQSKSGDCTLTTYTTKDVPADVYAGVNRHAPFICECGNMFDAPPKSFDDVEALKQELADAKAKLESAYAADAIVKHYTQILGEGIDRLKKQLADMTAARDAACDRLDSWIGSLPADLAEVGMADIAALRKVGT